MNWLQARCNKMMIAATVMVRGIRAILLRGNARTPIPGFRAAKVRTSQTQLVLRIAAKLGEGSRRLLLCDAVEGAAAGEDGVG